QNYPNPFNPSTNIGFTVPQASPVSLVVYDLLGRPVQTLVDGTVAAGAHEVVFEAGNLPSGTYVYRLQAGGQTLTRTLVLMK
ncbi:MAG: T9SS type A sorting domain-containing protein, partial [Bacteroidota bacterium]